MSDLPWFRMYSDAVDNEKLRLLAFEDRWHFVALLCLKQQGILDDKSNLMERKIAVKLGVQFRELDEIKRRLMDVHLIDKQFQPIGWHEHQFQSDSSKERTRKYRERKKKNACDVTTTSQQRHCDLLDTDTETDTDTDADIDLLFPDGNNKLSVKPTRNVIEPKKIVSIYHQTLPELNRVAQLSEKRKRSIQARAKKTLPTVLHWEEYFGMVRKSDFLMGNIDQMNGRSFQANFDWLINETNMLKVIEGRYANRTTADPF